MLQEQQTVNFELIFKQTKHTLSEIMVILIKFGILIRIYEIIIKSLEIVLPIVTKIIEEAVDYFIDWFWTTGAYYLLYIWVVIETRIKYVCIYGFIPLIIGILKIERWVRFSIVDYMCNSVTFLSLFLWLIYEKICRYRASAKYWRARMSYLSKPYLNALITIYLMITYFPVWLILNTIYLCVYTCVFASYIFYIGLLLIYVWTVWLAYKVYFYFLPPAIMLWLEMSFINTNPFFTYRVPIIIFVLKDALYLIRYVLFILKIAFSPVIEATSTAGYTTIAYLYKWLVWFLFALLYIITYKVDDERIEEALEKWRIQNCWEYFEEPYFFSIYDRETWDIRKKLRGFKWRFYMKQRWELRSGFFLDQKMYWTRMDEDFLIRRFYENEYVWRTDPVSGPHKCEYGFKNILKADEQFEDWNPWFNAQWNHKYEWPIKWEKKPVPPQWDFCMDHSLALEACGRPCIDLEENEYGETPSELSHLKYINTTDEEISFNDFEGFKMLEKGWVWDKEDKEFFMTYKAELWKKYNKIIIPSDESIRSLTEIDNIDYNEVDVCQVSGEFLEGEPLKWIDERLEEKIVYKDKFEILQTVMGDTLWNENDSNYFNMNKLEEANDELSDLTIFEKLYENIYNSIEKITYPKRIAQDWSYEEIISRIDDIASEQFNRLRWWDSYDRVNCWWEFGSTREFWSKNWSAPNPDDDIYYWWKGYASDDFGTYNMLYEEEEARSDLLHDEWEMETQVETTDKFIENKQYAGRLDCFSRDVIEGSEKNCMWDTFMYKWGLKTYDYDTNTNYKKINNIITDNEVIRRYNLDPESSVLIALSLGDNDYYYGFVDPSGWKAIVMLNSYIIENTYWKELLSTPVMNIQRMHIQLLIETIVDDLWYYYFISDYRGYWAFKWWGKYIWDEYPIHKEYFRPLWYMWTFTLFGKYFWDDDYPINNEWYSPDRFIYEDERGVFSAKMIDKIYGKCYNDDNHEHWLNKIIPVKDNLKDITDSDEDYPVKRYTWGRLWSELYKNADFWDWVY